MRCMHEMRFGAALHRDGTGATFALWAPAARQADLLLHTGRGTRALAAPRDAEGFHRVVVDDAAAGLRYQWRIDGHLVVPDPASRSNPAGPHEPSVLTTSPSS